MISNITQQNREGDANNRKYGFVFFPGGGAVPSPNACVLLHFAFTYQENCRVASWTHTLDKSETTLQ